MNTPETLNIIPEVPPLWTTTDMSRFLRCTERQIFELRKEGMPTIKLGGLVRFDPSDVRTWMEKRSGYASPRAAQLRDISTSGEDSAECAKSDLFKEFPAR